MICKINTFQENKLNYLVDYKMAASGGYSWPQLLLQLMLLLPHVAPICYDQSPFWFVSQAPPAGTPS
jgi:hypothetical protein